MSRLDDLREARRRGLLPPDMLEALSEYERRTGAPDMAAAQQPQSFEALLAQQSPSQDIGAALVPQVAPQDALRSALSGATLGSGDELRGAAYGLMSKLGGAGEFGPSYRAYRDEERAQLDRFRTEQPGAAFTSELGAGAGLGLLGAGTKMAKTAMNAPLLKRLGISSMLGGGGAALSATGEAPEMADVPGAVATAAPIGMALGPAVELGTTAVQALTRAAPASSAAARAVKKAVKRGDMTLSQVRARLKKASPGTVMADVNEGLLTKLDDLVNQPGRTRTRAISQLAKRSAKQHEEILNATGKGNYFENLDAAKEIKQKIASPIYKDAYAKGVKHTKELDDIFTGLEDAIPGAWTEAKKYGKLDILGGGDAVPDLGDAVPSLRGWQAVKEYLDDQVGALMRAGNSGKAGKIIALKNRLLRSLDGQRPEYAHARKIWAGVKSFENKMDEGLGFMKPSMSSEKLSYQMRGLPDSERLAYREGARQAIQDVMEKAGDTHDVSKFFRTPAMRAKIREIFGSREGAKILRTVENSAAKQRTYARVSGNSLTALRQASQAEEGLSKDILDAMSDFAFASPSQAGTSAMRKIMRRVPTSRESTRNLIGDMLTEKDPAKQQQILQMLMATPRPLPGAGVLAPAAAGAGVGILSGRE